MFVDNHVQGADLIFFFALPLTLVDDPQTAPHMFNDAA